MHCPHCYLDAGPDKYEDTMSVADFGKCVDNFPKGGLNSITLSGGEVFSLEERLYDYLDIIKDKIPDYKLVLQTSGYWAVDNKTTKDRLERLREFRVRKIDITSNDRFHEQKGFDKQNAERLQGLVEEAELGVSYRGCDYDIVPLGRGVNLETPKRAEFQQSCIGFLYSNELTVDWEGSVYPCCFGMFKFPGNLINEKLTKIVGLKGQDRELIQEFLVMNHSGFKGLADLKGIECESNNACLKCVEYNLNR